MENKTALQKLEEAFSVDTRYDKEIFGGYEQNNVQPCYGVMLGGIKTLLESNDFVNEITKQPEELFSVLKKIAERKFTDWNIKFKQAEDIKLLFENGTICNSLHDYIKNTSLQGDFCDLIKKQQISNLTRDIAKNLDGTDVPQQIVTAIFAAAEKNPELASNLAKLEIKKEATDACEKLKPIIEALGNQTNPPLDTNKEIPHVKELE